MTEFLSNNEAVEGLTKIIATIGFVVVGVYAGIKLIKWFIED